MRNHGIDIVPATAKRIATQHRDPDHPYRISHTVTPPEPSLTFENKIERLNFTTWAIEELEKGAIFIFSDKTYVEIGGTP